MADSLARQLGSAIGALVALIEANDATAKVRYLSSADWKRMDELDAEVYALGTTLGLTIGSVPTPIAYDPYGRTEIPMQGKSVYMTAGWRQKMASLRAVAELLADAGRSSTMPAKPKRVKKSHGKGGARLKINGGLTAYHQYANGKCGRYEPPIQVNSFAKELDVSPGSVSGFLTKAFGDYDAYVGACRQRTTLDTKLTAMNSDFATLKTAGRNPFANEEGERAEDD